METKNSERIKQFAAPILDLDTEKGIVRTYINKFNVEDSYSEMSLPGSFAKTFRERLKKMWWLLNHDWEKSLGVTIALEEDSIGAIATGKFNLKKQIAVDTYNDYIFFAENSRTLQHSVRVSPIKYIIENDVMKVSEWKMREWSTLTQPGAIEDTPMISIKSAQEDVESLRKALKLDYSDEKLKSIENKISSLETLIKAAAERTELMKSANDEQKIKECINFIKNINF
jgi:HK97 family phage prohead protease